MKNRLRHALGALLFVVAALVQSYLPLYTADAALSALTFSQAGIHPQAAAEIMSPGDSRLEELEVYGGKIYAGYGNYSSNIGPMFINPYNVTTGVFEGSKHRHQTEEIETFKHINGKLYAPDIDPVAGESTGGYAVGVPAGTWSHKSVGPALHMYDMATLDGTDLWIVGSNGVYATAWRSLDGGTTWSTVQSEAPSNNTSGAYARYYWVAVLDGKLYMRSSHAATGAGTKVFDGTSWSTIPISTPIANNRSVVFNGKLVTPAYGSLKIFDGTNLTTAPNVATRDLHVDGSYLYTLGISGELARTTDLVNWESLGSAPLDAASIAVTNDRVYIGGDGGKLYKSSLISERTPGANPENASITSFRVLPDAAAVGQSITITGEVAKAASCSIDNGIGAVTLSQGTRGTFAIQKTVPPGTVYWLAYTLSCEGIDGGYRATNFAYVDISAAPYGTDAVINSFNASSTNIQAGQSITLTTNVDTGNSCMIDNGIGTVTLDQVKTGVGTVTVSPTATTTYLLTCTGFNGGLSDSRSVDVTVSAQPLDAAITSFVASQGAITEGDSTLLTATVERGQLCAISDNGSLTLSGGTSGTATLTVSPTATTTYTLACTGFAGGSSATMTVTVTVTPQQVTQNANVTTFIATPPTVLVGQTATLSGTAALGQACTIDNGVGLVALSNGTDGSFSKSVQPSATTTYTIECQGLGGGISDSRQVTVTVNPVPIDAGIANFVATPPTIYRGFASRLEVAVQNGTNCQIDQGVGAVILNNASSGFAEVIVNPTTNTTYTLTCSGLYGGSTATSQVLVTVTDPPPVSLDSDTDGITDLIESAGPNLGDANNDGIPDKNQRSVTSFLTSTGTYLTLSSSGSCSINSDAASFDDTMAPSTSKTLVAAVGFALACDSQGASGQVKLFLDKMYDTTIWDVKKDNGNGQRGSILGSVTLGSEYIGATRVSTVSYQLVDGGALDQDGAANGTIVDPLIIESAIAAQPSNTAKPSMPIRQSVIVARALRSAGHAGGVEMQPSSVTVLTDGAGPVATENDGSSAMPVQRLPNGAASPSALSPVAETTSADGWPWRWIAIGVAVFTLVVVGAGLVLRWALYSPHVAYHHDEALSSVPQAAMPPDAGELTAPPLTPVMLPVAAPIAPMPSPALSRTLNASRISDLTNDPYR